jgi:hypothetical protein
MFKIFPAVMMFVVCAILFAASSAYGITASVPNIVTKAKSNAANNTAVMPAATAQVAKQKVPQQNSQASFPSLIILVNLGMSNKNTSNYGIVDLTVTLKNVTKTHTLNTTNFPGDHAVMPFRFSPRNDKIPLQIGDKYTVCASGEFLNAAVCQTGIIKNKASPISRTNIELG